VRLRLRMCCGPENDVPGDWMQHCGGDENEFPGQYRGNK